MFHASVAVLGLILLATPAAADDHAVTLFSSANCVDGSIEFQVTITGSEHVSADVAGFDVFVLQHGECEAVNERLNDDMFTIGSSGGQSFTAVHDADFEGNLFRYEVLPVDADRVPMEIHEIGTWDYLLNVDYGSCSSTEPLLGIGTLSGSGRDFGVLSPCPDTCWELEGWVAIPEARGNCEQYLNSGVPIEIYFTGFSAGGVDGASFSGRVCQASSCTIPISSGSWGSLKSHFE